MTMNPLPPQAYTKDTLLKAYQWLMDQDSSLKDIATTPDILVSLYLKALRDGGEALERPSIQNFKTELRNLAGMMGELEKPTQNPQPNSLAYSSPSMSPPAYGQQGHPQSVVNQPMMNQSLANHSMNQSMANQPMVNTASQGQTQVSYIEKTLTATAHAANHNQWNMEIFDVGTQRMIHEVKTEFNLSSDLETIRMLIKFGYMKSKDMLK